MNLLNQFEAEQLKSILRTSNYWARKNRNKYPEKIESAINTLYTWEDCHCDNSCDCKKHGCKQHLVRKSDLNFNEIFEQFLKCYLDESQHDAVRDGTKTGRGENAVKASYTIKKDWDKYKISNKSNLICNNWIDNIQSDLLHFKPNQSTIYFSKWLSILSMGIYVAYDTSSVMLLNRDYENPTDYLSLITKIRFNLIKHLEINHKSINEFCLYDNPNEFFIGIPAQSPRPIGNIIDKLYLTL